MDYKTVANQILESVGGKENIKKVNKDYTNLRFVLKDKSIARKDAIENIEGVKSVQVTETHFNVAIGAKVPEVYKELISITGEFKEEDEVISKRTVLSAKLKNIDKKCLIPFVCSVIVYLAVVMLNNMIPEGIRSYASNAALLLVIASVMYEAIICGRVFKPNQVLSSFIAGVVVGVNVYCMNIYAVLISAIAVIALYSIAFIIKK